MIGLDTNILIRYIVQDDEGQSLAASRLIESRCTEQATGFVSIVVLVELAWVLTAAYDYGKNLIVAVISQILRTTEFTVEEGDVVRQALREFETGNADFADCLIAYRNHSTGCTTTHTFDRKAAQGQHLTLVP